jgi:hypothetical protein
MRCLDVAKRALGVLSRPLSRWILASVPVSDPWQRFDFPPIPLSAFGSGCVHDFGWYFEGVSTVRAVSPEEIQRWLCGCRYVPDVELFHEPDFWQHPCTLERLRQGDCEDFALWAWRKLVDTGVEAEFIVGRSAFDPVSGRAETLFARHAWVLFPRAGTTWLLEPTARTVKKGLQPLDVVRQHYIPELGVTSRRRPFSFAGKLLVDRERQFVLGEVPWA